MYSSRGCGCNNGIDVLIKFQLSEKRDIYGPNYGRTRALKAKVASSSEEESDCSSGDPEDIGKKLAMLVKKFQKFTKKKGFRKSS